MSSRMNDMLAFIQISRVRMLHHYLPKIKRCLELLSEEEIWRIETPLDHSIGGIVEHIRLHIERNITRLENPGIRYETGIENSFAQEWTKKEEVIYALEEIFKELDAKLIQCRSEMYDVYHLVEHTGYHIGQIVDRTKRIKGKQFDFVMEGINEKRLKEKLKDEFESRN